MTTNQCPTTLSSNAFQLAGPPRSCRTAAKMGPDLEGRGHDPDLWLYRDRTLGLLRRYQRLSVQSGRLPSLLGRELFRTRVTSYRTTTLEDTVIFVHDVARGLEKLDSFANRLIAMIAFHDYTHDETARLLGCRRRTVGRRFPAAVDQLSEIFLQAGLLIRFPVTSAVEKERCQGAKSEVNPASHSAERK
jgi:hypothetical protein